MTRIGKVAKDTNIVLLQLLHTRILFGWRENYGEPKWWSPDGTHWGEDRYAVYEEDIVLHDGKVRVGNDGNGLGLYLEVTHKDGWRTIYAHLSQVYVKTGDYVQAGQVCYVTGDSGSAKNNPHLHWEIRVVGVRHGDDTGPKWQQNPNRYYGAVESPIIVVDLNSILQEFPLVSKHWVVVSDWVYIRSVPSGAGNNPIGTLQKGAELLAEKLVESEPGNRWIKLQNKDQYVAFYNTGRIYTEPVVKS